MLYVSNTLITAFSALVSSGKLGHGYILYGSPKGFPTHASMQLALSALCSQNPPCTHCPTCRQVRAHDHPNIRVLSSPTSLSVDHVRALVRSVQMGAREGHRLIACIPHAEQMTPQAANACLKTLEEPPKGLTFILSTHAPEQLLPTIRSRCTAIACPNVPDSAISSWITETTGHTHQGPISQALVAYVEKTTTYPHTLIPFDTMTQLGLREKLTLAESLAKDKDLAKLAMQQWLEEVMAEPQPNHHQATRANILLTHIKNSHYNLNPRLQLEALLIDTLMNSSVPSN